MENPKNKFEIVEIASKFTIIRTTSFGEVDEVLTFPTFEEARPVLRALKMAHSEGFVIGFNNGFDWD